MGIRDILTDRQNDENRAYDCGNVVFCVVLDELHIFSDASGQKLVVLFVTFWCSDSVRQHSTLNLSNIDFKHGLNVYKNPKEGSFC